MKSIMLRTSSTGNIVIDYNMIFAVVVSSSIPSVECMVITYSKGKDQPGKVANPARGQLNRENEYFPVPIRA